MKVFFTGERPQYIPAVGLELRPGVNEVSADHGRRLLELKPLCRRPAEVRGFEEPSTVESVENNEPSAAELAENKEQ